MVHRFQPAIFANFSASRISQFRKLARHLDVVDDPGLGYVQAGQPSDMRFVFLEFLCGELSDIREAVGSAAKLKFCKYRDFFPPRSNDDFSACLVCDPIFATESIHGLAAENTVTRFARTWFVIESGMNNTAIVTGLMAPQVCVQPQSK